MGVFSKSKTILPTAREQSLLEILWRLGEGTIDDLLAQSGEKPPPNYKTVQTILRIMERKKLVAHRVRGRAFVFRPRVKKEVIKTFSIRSFLERYFAGSRSALLLNLLEDESIKQDELNHLEGLIRRRRKEIRASSSPLRK